MTATSTTSTTPARLTGFDLIAHHDRNSSGNRTATVLAAGYRHPNGRPAFTDYYSALLHAQGRSANAQQVAAQLAASHEHAAADPAAWHGHTYGAPERFALLIITTTSGEQIGATLTAPVSELGYSDGTTYSTAEQLVNSHASHYVSAAQGPDDFPLTVTLHDRQGPIQLFAIEPGSEWQRSDGTTTTDAPIITDAFGDGISRCDRCGQIHDEDDGSTVTTQNRRGYWEVEQWCGDCAEDHATSCNDCGTVTDNRHIHRTGDNEEVCGDCIDNSYSTCDDCGELHHDEDLRTVDQSETVCRHCIDAGDGTRYHWHQDAGEWSTTPPDDDDDDDEHQGPGTMRRYGYHTDANQTIGHNIPDTGHTYGFELEYKGSPNDWQAVAAACDHRAILTNDSTVSGELVSIAHTAGTIRRTLAALATALAGTHNDTATGLHIHIDRRALTPWQWFTLSHYCARHSSTLEAIAGRHSNQWSDLKKLPATNWTDFARNWRSKCWPTRYAGFNLSKGPTVEMRFCRATKTPARALARFGMVQRLVSLGRLAPSQRPKSEAELKGWLAQDRWIREVTGWDVGPFNYRAALHQPEHQGDQQPEPPTVEQVDKLRSAWLQIERELSATEARQNHARRQVVNWTHDQGNAYRIDAETRLEYYRNERGRLMLDSREARQELEQAETLRRLASL